MPLAEHDNVVKRFPAERTDRPFTIRVLPRRSRGGWPIPNAHRPKAADEDVTVDGVAVTDDVSRCYVPPIGLGEVARNSIQPLGARSLPARGFGGDRAAGSATRRAVGMRLSEQRTGPSTRCRRRDCEETWGLRPAAARSRLPAPIRPETGPMPADHRLRLNDHESVQHAGRQPIQPGKYQTVDAREN
jgi:hypothetical protein